MPDTHTIQSTSDRLHAEQSQLEAEITELKRQLPRAYATAVAGGGYITEATAMRSRLRTAEDRLEVVSWTIDGLRPLLAEAERAEDERRRAGEAERGQRDAERRELAAFARRIVDHGWNAVAGRELDRMRRLESRHGSPMGTGREIRSEWRELVDQTNAS